MPPKFDPNEIKVGMFMVSGDMFRLACQKLCVRDIGLKLFFRHKVTWQVTWFLSLEAYITCVDQISMILYVNE